MRSLWRHCVLVVFSLLLLLSHARAQSKAQMVVVELKNGNVLKGTLLLYKKQGYELRLSEKTVVHIPLSDINEIKTLTKKSSRIYTGIQLGLFFGLRNNQDVQNILVAPSVQVAAGYKWKHWLQMGIGTGLEQYGKIGVIPLYAEVRGNIWKEGLSPFYALKLGKGFASVQDDFRYQDARGGLMTEIQAGINFRFKHFNWLLGTGYHLQKVCLEGVTPGWESENKRIQYRSLRRMISTTSVRFSF